MNINNLKEVKNAVEDLKKTKRSPPKEILDSLAIIQRELIKIRDFNMNISPENNNVYRRKIKSSLEYNIYKYLEKYHCAHMPQILSLDENYVEIPIYHFKKSLTKSDIIEILKTLRNFTKIGISHRAINPSHIMFDKNEVVLIDYGKACYLNSKPKFYSRKPIYASRNALKQEKCRELDDLESLGYVLLDLNLHEQLDTYDAKEIFVNQYQKIGDDRLRKYFSHIKHKNINYEDYINIFKE